MEIKKIIGLNHQFFSTSCQLHTCCDREVARVNTVVVFRDHIIINEDDIDEYIIKAMIRVEGDDTCCIGYVRGKQSLENRNIVNKE
jgi:hypothetical protein